MLTTTLSAATGGITAVTLERYRGVRKAWDVVSMCNGILSGLVSITAGTATVMPWAAIIGGFMGAVIYRTTSRILIRFHVDDLT